MDYKRLTVLDKRTPNRGANPYVDDYTGFTWNGVHSSNFNCFIENTGHLEFVGAPDFSNNFISPAFQTRTYYTGTASQSKKFQLNLVFYQLTLAELNAALHWLDRSIISDLYFDYEPYWKYSCKLASMGAIEKYPNGRTMYRGRSCDLYLCRVPLTFETVYHPEAISAYTVFKTSEQFSVYAEKLEDEYTYLEAGHTYVAEYPGLVIYESHSPHPIQFLPYHSPFVIEGTFLERGEGVRVLSDSEYIKLSNDDWADWALAYSLDAGASYMPFNQLKSGITEDDLAKNIRQDTSYNQEKYVDAEDNPLTVADVAKYWENMVIITPPAMRENNKEYWRVRLYNPSSHSTFFKLHFFNVRDAIDVWQVWNQDYMLYNNSDENPYDIDAYINSLQIMHVNMDLDAEHLVNLHYNSEDGTVLMGNQLIESVRGLSLPVCENKTAVANVLIPGAVDSDHPAYIDLEIQLTTNTGSLNQPQFAIEYDTYEYTV